MSIHQNDVPARAQPAGFAMPVANKRNGFHGSFHARFFVGLPCGRIGIAGILSDSAFWESPMAVPGADQKEFQLSVA